MYASNDKVIERILKDPHIKVTKFGKVYSRYSLNGNVQTKFRLVGSKHNQGYLWFRYKGSQILIQRLVYRKFVGKLDSTLVVNHVDGIKTNNRPSNLELITEGKNSEHSLHVLGNKDKLVSDNRGEKSAHAKLNNRIVLKLRKIYKTGKYTVTFLAKRCGVSFQSMKDALTGKSYKEVPLI